MATTNLLRFLTCLFVRFENICESENSFVIFFLSIFYFFSMILFVGFFLYYTVLHDQSGTSPDLNFDHLSFLLSFYFIFHYFYHSFHFGQCFVLLVSYQTSIQYIMISLIQVQISILLIWVFFICLIHFAKFFFLYFKLT